MKKFLVALLVLVAFAATSQAQHQHSGYHHGFSSYPNNAFRFNYGYAPAQYQLLLPFVSSYQYQQQLLLAQPLPCSQAPPIQLSIAPPAPLTINAAPCPQSLDYAAQLGAAYALPSYDLNYGLSAYALNAFYYDSYRHRHHVVPAPAAASAAKAVGAATVRHRR